MPSLSEYLYQDYVAGYDKVVKETDTMMWRGEFEKLLQILINYVFLEIEYKCETEKLLENKFINQYINNSKYRIVEFESMNVPFFLKALRQAFIDKSIQYEYESGKLSKLFIPIQNIQPKFILSDDTTKYLLLDIFNTNKRQHLKSIDDKIDFIKNRLSELSFERNYTFAFFTLLRIDNLDDGIFLTIESYHNVGRDNHGWTLYKLKATNSLFDLLNNKLTTGDEFSWFLRYFGKSFYDNKIVKNI